MGIFDLMAALAQVASERRALRRSQPGISDFAAIDPGTGGRAFPEDPRPIAPEAASGGFLTDVIRASQNRITSTEAIRTGLPESAGLTRKGLEELLEQRALPLKQAEQRQKIKSLEALGESRIASTERETRMQKISGDPVFKLAIQEVGDQIKGNPLLETRYLRDPDALHQLYLERYDALKAIKAGKKPKLSAKEAARPASTRIRVKIKATGVTGTIEEKDFISGTMEKIGG